MSSEIDLVPYAGSHRLVVKPVWGKRTVVSMTPGAQRRGEGFSFPPNPRYVEYVTQVLGGAELTDRAKVWHDRCLQREYELLLIKNASDAAVSHPSAHLLEPYQRVAVALGLATQAMLNADDCGLGKTCTSIVTAEASGRDRRVLVICRNAVKWWWADELRAWSMHPCPEVTVLANTRAEREKQLREYHRGWLIMHWEALRLLPQLGQMSWDWVILDEAHHAKSPKAQRSQAVRKLRAWGRLALTATPLSNDVSEVWALLNFLRPEVYTSYWGFYEMYVRYVDLPYGGRKVLGVRNAGLLREELAPLMVRRLDSHVRRDALPVRYRTLRVQMGPEQARAYIAMAKAALVALGSKVVEASTVLAQTTRLRQLACSLGVLGPTDVSAKLDALMDLLDEAPHQKWVVFTTFEDVLCLVESRLRKKGVSFVSLRGGMGNTQVREAVHRFQTASVQVLAGTVQTGGEGLDLTAARQLVFVDQWWDPRVRYQACKRVDRRGQTHPVVVTTLECIGTIDETIGRLLARKEAATAEVILQEVRGDLEEVIYGKECRGYRGTDS